MALHHDGGEAAPFAPGMVIAVELMGISVEYPTTPPAGADPQRVQCGELPPPSGVAASSFRGAHGRRRRAEELVGDLHHRSRCSTIPPEDSQAAFLFEI
jgi:hypothetical protein